MSATRQLASTADRANRASRELHVPLLIFASLDDEANTLVPIVVLMGYMGLPVPLQSWRRKHDPAMRIQQRNRRLHNTS